MTKAYKTPACQLYLISPLETGGDFPQRLERALDAGGDDRGWANPVAAFQFRVKGLDQHEAAELAAPLQAICAARDVAFIVNDDVALARRLNADGVHLGQSDGDLRDAREELGAVLGANMQIGVSCHDSRHLAMDAGEKGADYVAFGAFFPSSTKDTSHHAEVELIEFWAGLFEVPCVAIGGITSENCGPLVKAGADFIAVSGAVWKGDEAASVKAFAKQLIKPVFRTSQRNALFE